MVGLRKYAEIQKAMLLLQDLKATKLNLQRTNSEKKSSQEVHYSECEISYGSVKDQNV